MNYKLHTGPCRHNFFLIATCMREMKKGSYLDYRGEEQRAHDKINDVYARTLSTKLSVTKLRSDDTSQLDSESIP